MLPKNQRIHSAQPKPKNQNSSVAQTMCSTVAREKAPKNVVVNNQAIGSKKIPKTVFSQRRGMTRNCAAAAAPCEARRRLGFLLAGLVWGRLLTRGACLAGATRPAQKETLPIYQATERRGVYARPM